MSSEPVIQLGNVCKVYRVYSKPLDRLKEALWHRKRRLHREVRSLQDISLDIEPGHTVGVIGRNGSGKTTLLRIIAGVLQPTSGSVEVRGSVAALLELGSGFHPEFTGRENIYINASVHGLSRREIDARYQEIADYCELGDFLEQPVKTYSTGMVSRLAFATAIQVDRDILIVDETLSVGDAMFQRKCMATIEAIKNSGRTILFVSHSLETVKALCDQALLIERGRVVAEGKPLDVINEYSRLISETGKHAAPAPGGARPPVGPTAAKTQPTLKSPPRSQGQIVLPHRFMVPLDLVDVGKEEFPFGNGEAEIFDVETLAADGTASTTFESGDEVAVTYKVRFHAPQSQPACGMAINRLDGVRVYSTNTLYQGVHIGPRGPGDEIRVEFRFFLRLVAGNYYLSVGCVDRRGDEQPLVLHGRFDLLLLTVLPVEHATGIAALQAEVTVSTLANSQAA